MALCPPWCHHEKSVRYESEKVKREDSSIYVLKNDISHHFTLVFWCFFLGGGLKLPKFRGSRPTSSAMAGVLGWMVKWWMDGQAPPSARLPSTFKSADTTGTHRRGLHAVSGWLVGPSKKGRWMATEIWLTELDMIETWWSSEVKPCETFFNSRLCVADCHPFCCSFEHLSKDSYVGFLSKEGFLHIFHPSHPSFGIPQSQRVIKQSAAMVLVSGFPRSSLGSEQSSPRDSQGHQESKPPSSPVVWKG